MYAIFFHVFSLHKCPTILAPKLLEMETSIHFCRFSVGEREGCFNPQDISPSKHATDMAHKYERNNYRVILFGKQNFNRVVCK